MQNYNIVFLQSHCYHSYTILEPMKEPHSKDLSKMHTVIKCTDHNKLKLKEAKVAGTTASETMTQNGHIREEHSLIMFCSYPHLSIVRGSSEYVKQIVCFNEMHSTVREMRSINTRMNKTT